ncbi:MAG: hypothetical protein Q8L08_02315 [Candidatus Nanopelagicaceae bacterium]|nr:hypothetical protein [Candidatus Nanopelagicaceae bacterium]
MTQWLRDNVIWFGPILATVVAIGSWFVSKKVFKVRQSQRGGDGSTNIQVGRDINLNEN